MGEKQQHFPGRAVCPWDVVKVLTGNTGAWCRVPSLPGGLRTALASGFLAELNDPFSEVTGYSEVPGAGCQWMSTQHCKSSSCACLSESGAPLHLRAQGC